MGYSEGVSCKRLTTEELQIVFAANDVPANYYSFGGMGGGDCYVLEQQNGTWKTFYSERGSAGDIRTYANEDEACQGMFQMVARMVRSSQCRNISSARRPDRRSLLP